MARLRVAAAPLHARPDPARLAADLGRIRARLDAGDITGAGELAREILEGLPARACGRRWAPSVPAACAACQAIDGAADAVAQLYHAARIAGYVAPQAGSR